MLFFRHLTSAKRNEPMHWSQFVCLRMTERLLRGSRVEDLKVLAEEAADAHRDAVAISRMG